MLGIIAHGVPLNKSGVLELRLLEPLEDQVVLQGKIQNKAMLMPVLGDMAHILTPMVNGAVRNILPAQGNISRRLVQSRQAIDQLRLAVAVDTGNAHDFSGPDAEAHMVYGVALVGVRGHAHILHPKDLLLGLGGRFLHLQLHRAAHHHVRQLLLIGFAGVYRTNIPALAQHGDTVGHLHDFVELMGDKEDGLPLSRQILHDLHKLVDLLGRQHSSRLVKNKDLVIPVEHLQDLYTLLHTHGDVLHLGVHIYPQAIPLRQLLHLFTGFLLLHKTHFGGLRPQNDIIQHREYIHQLEMLVYHSDTQGGRHIRVGDIDFFAVFANLACLRLIQAEQYAHQRGFTGAVFAQQSVDLAPAELQRDVVVGLDAWELLCDVKHFDHILGSIFHAATYFLSILFPRIIRRNG